MNLRLRGLLAAATLLIPTALQADTVVLKNGDRITGSVVKTDGPNLIFHSELAGDIKVPLDAVTALTTTGPAAVTFKDGRIAAGPAALDPSAIEVHTTGDGTVKADRATVAAIRSQDEQKAYQANIDRYAHPGIFDLWAGTVDVGLAVSRGNSQTANFSTAFHATRATKRDKLNVYFTSIYATQETYTPGVSPLVSRYESGTSANAKRGGLSDNINVSAKFFVWGSLDFENNALQELNLRVNPAGGLGYHVFKSDKGYFDLQAGASLNREWFASSNQTYAEAVVSDEYDRTINKRSHIHQSFRFFPNVSDTGQYRMNLDVTGSTALTKLLSFQVSLSDRYISNPPATFFPAAPIKNNDLIFTTGVRMTFAR